MISEFVDPFTKEKLVPDNEDTLFLPHDDQKSSYRCHDGCYDFSSISTDVKELRRVYDEFYSSGGLPAISIGEIEKVWQDNLIPWRKTLLDSIGPLSGRRVLLLGNGVSYREFYFLLQGADVVFTDLSFSAVIRAKTIFKKSDFAKRYATHVEFHAVDAVHMPFPDGSFDVIYGHKFISFIKDFPLFFSELSRCLKPGGICRFVDDAYSPNYQFIRFLWCPFKKRQWKSMSALDRVRSAGSPTSVFGLKIESFAPYVQQFGFSRLVFIRSYFFLRLSQLFWVKLFGWNPLRLRYIKPWFYLMKWLDTLLMHTCWMKRNGLALICGFDKQL